MSACSLPERAASEPRQKALRPVMLTTGKWALSEARTRVEGAAVRGMDAAPDWGADEAETGLATLASITPLVPLTTLGEQARAYAEGGHAEHTRRAYRA